MSANYNQIEPLFDFERGEFVLGQNGQIRTVSGRDALKNWIAKLLHTPRGKYRVYDGTSYGTICHDLIGRALPQAYILAEVERDIKEAVMKHEAVNAVDCFNVQLNDNELTVSFKVHSDYGAIEVGEVTL